MKYIVAYTLKHNEIPDTFKDEYMVFGDTLINSHQNALRYYKDVISEEIIEEEWHVFTASISIVIESTD
jgi:hypothetical protein